MREIYNDDKLFDNWLNKANAKGIEGLTKNISDLVLNYVKDMSLGLNVSNKSKKGGRSKKRLNNSRQKIIFVLRKLDERGIKNIKKIKAEDLHKLFEEMRSGDISNRFGKPYLSTGDYVKDFKAFWHWHQKKEKSAGNLTEDITEDLDRRGEKPKFVYFTEEELENMTKIASRDLQIIMVVIFDSGCRVKELMNIQVKDFSKDFKELTIKEETAKTFGRKIKLMLCSEQVINYIKELDLKQDDYLIQKTPKMANAELRKIGNKVLPDKTKEKQLSLYDFRHSSACFWVTRYKSESALKYRFGWKKSDMIHYYTEFLGMKDTITQDDLYSDITKTELERKIEAMEKLMKEVFPKAIKTLKEVKIS